MYWANPVRNATAPRNDIKAQKKPVRGKNARDIYSYSAGTKAVIVHLLSHSAGLLVLSDSLTLCGADRCSISHLLVVRVQALAAG